MINSFVDVRLGQFQFFLRAITHVPASDPDGVYMGFWLGREEGLYAPFNYYYT